MLRYYIHNIPTYYRLYNYFQQGNAITFQNQICKLVYIEKALFVLANYKCLKGQIVAINL